MNQVYLTFEEYSNLVNYILDNTFLTENDHVERMLNDMGIRREGIGANKYFIEDKQKWMLAKIKYAF